MNTAYAYDARDAADLAPRDPLSARFVATTRALLALAILFTAGAVVLVIAWVLVGTNDDTRLIAFHAALPLVIVAGIACRFIDAPGLRLAYLIVQFLDLFGGAASFIIRTVRLADCGGACNDGTDGAAEWVLVVTDGALIALGLVGVVAGWLAYNAAAAVRTRGSLTAAGVFGPPDLGDGASTPADALAALLPPVARQPGDDLEAGKPDPRTAPGVQYVNPRTRELALGRPAASVCAARQRKVGVPGMGRK